MNDKEAYIREVEGQLKTWQHDIYQFKIIAEDTGEEHPDRQIDYYRKIEEIVNMEKKVADKLNSLKNDEVDDWQQSKEVIDALRGEVSETIVQARAVIN